MYTYTSAEVVSSILVKTFVFCLIVRSGKRENVSKVSKIQPLVDELYEC